MSSRSQAKLLHPLESFGVKHALAGDIRVEPLRDRLTPKVPFPHRHDFFQLLVVIEASGWHEIDFQRHRVGPRQIYLMKPAQVHSWSLAGKLKGFVIEFTRESLPRDTKTDLDLISEVMAAPDLGVVTSLERFREIEAVCEIMNREFTQKERHHELCLRGYLRGLLAQLIRELGVRAPGPEQKADLVERFRQLVEKSYMKEHRVEPYAKNLGVSPKALTMHLSRALGKSPRAVLQERSLLEARRLLAYSELSIAEIGYALGFEDANYFSRFFRQHAGLTPSVFRERSRKGRTS